MKALPARLRSGNAGLYAVLVAINSLAWAWALLAFRNHPVLLGTGLLAYSLGLRHAVDADHIAAIDNVTRKLMQTGRRPVAIGLCFSLGHSTVVVLACVAIMLAAGPLAHRFGMFQDIGGVVGTLVSASFLFIIAMANLLVLCGVYRSLRQMRAGEICDRADMEKLLRPRGMMGRIFRPLFGLVQKNWHMYLLGFLFGLGFDTATEIGVLGISAAQATQGLSAWSILIFPALFTAGMSLVDTLDSILMVRAYDWALIKPFRKLYYNLAVTFISVLAALAVGGTEVLGLIQSRFRFTGHFWNGVRLLNDHFGAIGYLIIAVFLCSWLLSVMVYRWRFYDRLENEWG